MKGERDKMDTMLRYEWDGRWFEKMNEINYGLKEMNEMDYVLKEMNEMDCGLRKMRDTMTKAEAMWGWIMMPWWNPTFMKSIAEQRLSKS